MAVELIKQGIMIINHIPASYKKVTLLELNVHLAKPSQIQILNLK